MTMERKIGEIFEFGGEWYQCVEDDKENLCLNCDLYDEKHKLCNENLTGNCHIAFRKDSKSVIFKKLEKAGKPHRFGKKLMQPYKLFAKPVVRGKGRRCTLLPFKRDYHRTLLQPDDAPRKERGVGEFI